MHKRFAIALQTVRGIAVGASGRGGPGLGNGGKPARRCGDLFASVGSETGRRQPESLADVPEPLRCQYLLVPETGETTLRRAPSVATFPGAEPGQIPLNRRFLSIIYNVIGLVLGSVGLLTPIVAISFHEAGCISVVLSSMLLLCAKPKRPAMEIEGSPRILRAA